jgi:alpha-L-fucosidase
MRPYFTYAMFLTSLAICAGFSQQKPFPPCSVVALQPGESIENILSRAGRVCPSPRQIAWQEREFSIFIHFGMNTFTDREWGKKDESPGLFNPSELDARQWVSVAREAGAKQLIVVAKHHDGFCLWPSRGTDYSVKASPWRDGKGDVIAQVAAACRESGLKLGVYLSPWDISSPLYGTEAYNTYFKNQLRELLTGYGSIAEVWFDGACGEGPNGKRQVYDWRGYYALIRELQPDAVIAVMGPDVRWVGTESGYGREAEWSVLPLSLDALEEFAESSERREGGGAFVPPENVMQEDLGSRERLRGATGLVWYPSEVDVSIRPGWFYHAAQDSQVKTPGQLVDIYYSSIGRNSYLLLNVPPDRRGLIHERDIRSLRGMRVILSCTFSRNFAAHAEVTCLSPGGSDPKAMVDDDPKTFWSADSAESTSTVEFDLGREESFDRILLQENFRSGQRVEEFAVEARQSGVWRGVVRGTTIGYKRLLRFGRVTARHLRLHIVRSRGRPEIASFGLYRAASDEP